MAWRVANSLIVLRTQVNVLFPQRDTSSDGTIGDTAHAATKSEHNPDANGVVRAWDCDADLSPTVKVQALVDALLKARDTRILYIIHRGKMYRSYPKTGVKPWEAAPYTGKNAHMEHMHISAVEDSRLYDSKELWKLGDLGKAVSTSSSPPDPQKPGVQRGIMATYFRDSAVAYSDVPKGWNERPGCALPYRFPEGPRRKVKVTNSRTKLSVICDVIDVGPHNTNDAYWLKPGGRPVAESGKGNKAGIDLTPAAAKAIGLNGLEPVNWEFV